MSVTISPLPCADCQRPHVQCGVMLTDALFVCQGCLRTRYAQSQAELRTRLAAIRALESRVDALTVANEALRRELDTLKLELTARDFERQEMRGQIGGLQAGAQRLRAERDELRAELERMRLNPTSH